MPRTQTNKHPLVPSGTEGVPQVEVEFLRTTQFECDGRRKGPTFYKGKRYVFDEPFASRWLKRGAAYDTSRPAPAPQSDEDEAVDVGGERQNDLEG